VFLNQTFIELSSFRIETAFQLTVLDNLSALVFGFGMQEHCCRYHTY
jgi:hypothetical protein